MQTKKLLDFQTSLLKDLANNKGLNSLAEKLSYSVGCPVILTSPSYRIITSTLSEQELLNKYIKVFPSQTNNYHQLTVIEGQTDQGFVFPIKSNHDILGFLIIICSESEQKKITEYASIAVDIWTVELLKQNQILQSKRELKDPFVFDLLYGNIDSDEDIINRGRLWGWQLEKPHCAVVFELDEYEQHTSDRQLALNILDIVETEITKMNQPPIVFRKKGEITAILTISTKKRQERKASINILVKKVLALAGEIYPEKVLRAGSGRTYSKPSDIFRSYQEAKVALEIGRIMNLKSQVPFFRDLGLARILYNHDRQELEEFYKDTLGELIRHDQEQNTDFVKTLESFFLNYCDLKAAADNLFLHPNTLRYRLKKIEELLDVDLNDTSTRLDLMAAFKIKYIKQV